MPTQKNDDVRIDGILGLWTRFCCRHPFQVIFYGLAVIVLMSCGLFKLEILNDPVSLWSAPTSRARIEKKFFDEHFGPFFRVQQVIISRDELKTFDYKGQNYSNLVHQDFLIQLLFLQENITQLKGANHGTKMESVCFSPMKNGKCAIQSPLIYFQSNLTILKWQNESANVNYLDHLKNCVSNPASMDDYVVGSNRPCLAAWGGPGFPHVLFGGYTPGSESAQDILSQSNAIIFTFLLHNGPEGSSERTLAEDWETTFLSFMEKIVAKNDLGPGIRISYFSEKSIEDELKRQSESDISTIAISYLVMFGYVSVSLGQYNSRKRALVDSKIGLGLTGVLIVLASVASSIGLTSFFGVKATLIIVEVLPFLVLAVGVDNIFILVQAFQRMAWDENESVEDRMSRVVSTVGPSIILSTSAESCCFFIGSLLANMPAVTVFALNAGLALVISFFLQMSLFLALFYLDTKRQLQSRVDVLFCVQTSRSDGFMSTNEEMEKHSIRFLSSAGNGRLHKLFSKHFAPFIMRDIIRIPLLIITIGWTLMTFSILPEITIGLDQEVSMPADSYVLRYFKDQKSLLRAGAPLYFVVESAEKNPSPRILLDFKNQFDLQWVRGDTSSAAFSLPNQIANAVSGAKAGNKTKKGTIVSNINSWTDDYISWRSSPNCLMAFNSSQTFCPSYDEKINRADVCYSPKPNPDSSDFYTYLEWFLSDVPTKTCPKGGYAAYGSAVALSSLEPNGKSIVMASYFSTYHAPAVTSGDFIQSMADARRLADDVQQSFRTYGLEARVFPYSFFYVFYEQYLT